MLPYENRNEKYQLCYIQCYFIFTEVHDCCEQNCTHTHTHARAHVHASFIYMWQYVCVSAGGQQENQGWKE